MSLVEVVDEVLELLETDERFRFTLDGQLATVDDYLEIRPENEGRIRALVEGGRLAIGPWQILMDEFLVSGETILRNLELGMTRAEELGGAMTVGYLPDMFGHVAQMPQLLRSAGIETAVVWRGVPAAVESHAFLWEAPDGSAVRTEFLAAGYDNAAYVFEAPEPRLERLEEAMRPWFGEDEVLGMVGTDHMPPVRDLPARLPPAARIGTLADYLDGGPARDTLSRWRGELRSAAQANLLPGVVSTRIDLKAAAAHAERWLERYAEPLDALYGDGGAEPFLREAWGRVIQNSAHDSICGCSADEVSAQVLVRYAEAEQIGRELTRRVLGRIVAEAPRGAVAVVNPSPQARTDLVELDLAIPAEWEAVALETPEGELLPTQEVRRQEPLLWEVLARGVDVPERVARRLHGRELFGRVLNGYRIEQPNRLTLEVADEPDPEWLDVDQLLREIALATADGDWTLRIEARPRRTLLANVPAPPLGWTTVRPSHAPVPGTPTKVWLNAPETRLVRGGDVGDSYNYAPPPADLVVDEPLEERFETVAKGPLRAVAVLHRTYEWDGRRVETQTRFEQRAGEPFVRIRIDFDNPSDDQRVRVHVPLREPADCSHAEGQFAVVERHLQPEGGYGEVPLPTYPAHGFVTAGGVALLLDHASEYEVVDGRELALTVLRSTGLISRSDNPYREDPAGPELPIPAAQLRGPRSFSFAYYGGATEAGVLLDQYRIPFITASGTGSVGALRAEGGPQLEGAALSSLRRRDGRIEARVVNTSSAPRTFSFGSASGELRSWEIRALTL
jgi:mannosylglycerate hydrolase